MAFVPRVFLSPQDISEGSAWVTSETDINHVKNVLRIPVGGKVTLCDGAGLIRSGIQLLRDAAVSGGRRSR